MNIFLYGPSGTGKSTTGTILAQNLDRKFIDLDHEIEKMTCRKIRDIFFAHGEAEFRKIESEILHKICKENHSAVIALGGGALLNPVNQIEVEKNGVVLLLSADFKTLLAHVQNEPNQRPKLEGDPKERLEELLSVRKAHYASFTNVIDVSNLTPQDTAREAQIRLGIFRIQGMGQPYDIDIQSNSLDQLGQALHERLSTKNLILVCDETVRNLYVERVITSLEKEKIRISIISIPAGEQYKTMETITSLWQGFIQAKVERNHTIVALGGGVVGDLTGFAAATFLRGIAWINVPTTLLSMVDSSLGGKVGANLPQGKNLIGAFHAPQLVYTDPQVLRTLPENELCNGMAETIKHAIIADPHLYQLCANGLPENQEETDLLVSRAIAVKAHIIEADPFEQNIRQVLNLGHTIGHGIELASGYRLSHGESISIGLAAESRLAEKIGIADRGLTDEIVSTLSRNGLPVQIPDWIDRRKIIEAMCLDKKRKNGQIHFALPVRIGQVQSGLVIDNWKSLIEL